MKLFCVMLVLCAVLFSGVSVRGEISGELVFRQKCAMCHLVNGKKGGTEGPNLSKIGSRMSAEQLLYRIDNPKKINPNTKMPSLRALPPQEKEALIRFLQGLK